MFHFAERACRRGANALAGAIAAFQFGKTRLNLFIAAAQCVIFAVRYKRRILLVIGRIMGGYFFGQPRQFRFGLHLAECVNGRVCRH